MDDGTKKPVMIAIIIVCLGAAGAVTFWKHSGSSGGIDSIPSSKMMWVKCRNPQCNAEYQMSEKEYYKEIKARLNPAAMMATPALICKKCGKPSVYKAFKCPYCGKVFFANSVPNDFPDRCPYCHKSKTEESRKARLAGRK